jgi:hypothetical protein
MLGDAVAAKKGSGEAKDSLEVIDVAQLLARSVHRNGAKAGGNGTADDAGTQGVDAAPAADVTSAGEGLPTTAGETTAAGSDGLKDAGGADA